MTLLTSLAVLIYSGSYDAIRKGRVRDEANLPDQREHWRPGNESNGVSAFQFLRGIPTVNFAESLGPTINLYVATRILPIVTMELANLIKR